MGLHILKAEVYECIFVLTALCWSQAECGNYGRTGSYGSYWNSELECHGNICGAVMIVGNTGRCSLWAVWYVFCMYNIVKERYISSDAGA
jgi:hypothetical protein